MAFTVDDGNGLQNANAYITVAFFKTYHDDRGNDYSLGSTDPLIQQKIVQATDYIDRRFKGTFVGYRNNTLQSLEWPRVGAFYGDGRGAFGIPIEVQQATAEYALRALSSAIAPDPAYEDSNAPVIEREDQVGPIIERRVFANAGASATFRKYPLADSLLKELTIKGSYLMRV